jgi:hypothetical protein
MRTIGNSNRPVCVRSSTPSGLHSRIAAREVLNVLSYNVARHDLVVAADPMTGILVPYSWRRWTPYRRQLSLPNITNTEFTNTFPNVAVPHQHC